MEGTGTKIGTAINYWHLNDSTYTRIAAENYNVVTAEASCKMNMIAKGGWGHYDYSGCDGVKNFAKKHGMAMRGHTLIWAKNGDWIPNWLKQQSAGGVEAFMKQYIQNVVRHMDYPYVWDVVNEALNDNGTLRNDHVFAKVPDFICKSFKWAHEASPNTKLYINEYSVLNSEGWSKKKSDALYNLVKSLKNRGCPIHGVGFQSHITTNFLYDGLQNSG